MLHECFIVFEPRRFPGLCGHDKHRSQLLGHRFQSAGGVHRIAQRGQVDVLAAAAGRADPTKDCRACMNPDPDPERCFQMILQLHVQNPQGPFHGDGGFERLPACLAYIVRNAEHGHDAVADIFVDIVDR